MMKGRRKAGPRSTVPGLAVLLVVLAGCGAPPPEGDRGGPASEPPPFSPAPLVRPTFAYSDVSMRAGAGQQSPGAEPGVAAAPDGTLYIIIWTELYRSTDGGATWEAFETPFVDFGDSDIVVTPDGTLHYVGMAVGSQDPPRLPYAHSRDRGQTWSDVIGLETPGALVDRPWIASSDDGNLLVTWVEFDGQGNNRNLASTSSDGGRTWTGPSLIADPGWHLPGPPVWWTTSVFQPMLHGNGRDWVLAASHDGGLHWGLKDGPARQGAASLFPSLAADAAGNLYLAAAHDPLATGLPGRQQISMWTSTSLGSSWQDPVRLHDSATRAVMPWAVATETGRVAVMFYEDISGSPLAPGSWVVSLAASTDAHLANATWGRWQVSDSTVATGNICTRGSGCSQDEWTFKDFFEWTPTPRGGMLASWMEERPFVGPVAGVADTLWVVAGMAPDDFVG